MPKGRPAGLARRNALHRTVPSAPRSRGSGLGGLLDLGLGGLGLGGGRLVLDDRSRGLGLVLGRTLGGGLGLAGGLLSDRQRLDELDDRHRGVVAATRAELDDAGVTTRTGHVARRDLFE